MTTEELDKQAEVEKIKTALRHSGCRDWSFCTAKKKIQEDKTKKEKKNVKRKIQSQHLPYVKGLSEATARIMMKYEITCVFKLGMH